MTKQEYYDLLVRSAADGTFPSGSPGECKYRGVGKQRCAVGVLIPDEMYTPGLEGKTVEAEPVYGLLEEHGLIPEGLDIEALRRVQSCHDRCVGDGWSAALFLDAINRQICFYDCEKTYRVS